MKNCCQLVFSFVSPVNHVIIFHFILVMTIREAHARINTTEDKQFSYTRLCGNYGQVDVVFEEVGTLVQGTNAISLSSVL